MAILPSRDGGSSDSSNDATSTIDEVRNPDEQLRAAAGAPRGATGSTILASGGDPFAAAIAARGSGTAGSGGFDSAADAKGAVQRQRDAATRDDPRAMTSAPNVAANAESSGNKGAEVVKRETTNIVKSLTGGSGMTGLLVAGAGAVAILVAIVEDD